MAHLIIHNDQIIRKKLPTKILRDGDLEIESYDVDNFYPQRMEQIMLKSPLTKSAVKVLTDFINGDGFENGDEVINDDGQTINDILDLVSKDIATYQGYSLLLDFDGMGGVAAIQYLPFPFVRFGKPDKFGRHKDVKVSTNWENDREKQHIQIVQTFKLFNPLVAGEDVRSGKGGSQVLYVTQIPNQYPLTSFDAVADAAQTDAELQTFELNTVTKGFAGVTLLKVPGGWEEGTKEETEVRELGKRLEGAKGGGIIALKVDDGDLNQNLLENVPADNKDRLFDLTTIHVRDIIGQSYNQPSPLSGISPSGSVFSQQAFKDAFLIYNAFTKNDRNRIARTFKKILNLWGAGAIDPGDIIPQEFEVEEVEEPKDAPVIPIIPDQIAQTDNNLTATYGPALG